MMRGDVNVRLRPWLQGRRANHMQVRLGVRTQVGDGAVGPITKTLQRLFFAAARGDDPAFADSLTPVYTTRA